MIEFVPRYISYLAARCFHFADKKTCKQQANLRVCSPYYPFNTERQARKLQTLTFKWSNSMKESNPAYRLRGVSNHASGFISQL